MSDILKKLEEALAAQGLTLRGGFCEEDVTLYLIGHGGSSHWSTFEESNEFNLPEDPLDSWTKQVVGKIADDLGGEAVYPSDGPPYAPFQQWVRKAEDIKQSPIGIMLHPEYGLWHAYRAAIKFEGQHELPVKPDTAAICEACADRPCLNACPVGAFKYQEYDYQRCADFLHTEEGRPCMEQGCRARHACPVGQDYAYQPAHAHFHMSAFRRNHS